MMTRKPVEIIPECLTREGKRLWKMVQDGYAELGSFEIHDFVSPEDFYQFRDSILHKENGNLQT